MELLEGRALGRYYDLTMEIRGNAQHARSSEALALTLENGDEVELLLDEAKPLANFDEEQSFGDFVRAGLGKAFLDRAPGDHVKVRMHGLWIEENEPLAVMGEVDRSASPGQGYRDTGDVSIRSVHVALVAAGASAAKDLQESQAATMEKAARAEQRPAATRKPSKAKASAISIRLPLIMGGLALGLGLSALLIGKALVWAGLHMAAIAIFYGRRRRFVPDMRTAREDLSGYGKRMGFGRYYALGASAFTIVVAILVAIIRSPESSQGAVLACSGLVAGVALGAALSLVLAQRRAAARLRMLARAEPVVEPGLWGALDGRVESGSYKRTRVHTLERYVQEDADGRTRTQRWWTYEDTVKASDFKITLDDGSTLKVEVKGAVLAAVDSWQEKTRLIEQIASGDRIRVVGRPARENERWTMRSTGVDSLLILATRQGDAATAAARALRGHYLALGALVVVAATSMVLALVL